MFGYSDAYILFERENNCWRHWYAHKVNKKLIFKNIPPFKSRLSKINNLSVDIVEDTYNLIKYSDNCSKTEEILWNYYRDKLSDSANKNNDAGDYRINNNKTTTTKYFEYKTQIIGSTPADNNTLWAEVVVPLKYLSNFWRSLDLLLINCEIELDLSWSRKCVISEISRTAAIAANPPNPAREKTKTNSATFQIISPKLYIPVNTLSISDNIEFLENINPGFKRTISLNKYGSKRTRQSKSDRKSLDIWLL